MFQEISGNKGTGKTSEFVIVPEERVEVAGAVVYWRLEGNIPSDSLAKAWQGAGLTEDKFPRKPGRMASLRRAAKEMVGGDLLVRSTPEGAWVFVQEAFEEGSNPSYQTVLFASSTAEGLVFTDGEASAKMPGLQSRVEQAFKFYQHNHTASDISTWLVGLAEASGAVPLRDSGGIYFVPQKASAEWRRVTQVLDACSAHKTFAIPAMRSSDAMQAITDAVLSDAERSAAALEKGAEEVGALALKGRLAKCEALLTKISTYDELLSTQLQCRNRIEELQASLVAAIFKAEAE